MFEALSDKLATVFNKITSRGVLTEDDINSALREIRIALLEADVALPVVKEFINQVREQAIGEKVVRSVQPGQMVIKIVHDELVKVLGTEAVPLNLNAPAPLSILMVGLQGSGKTTSAAKIAKRLAEKIIKKFYWLRLIFIAPPRRSSCPSWPHRLRATPCRLSTVKSLPPSPAGRWIMLKKADLILLFSIWRAVCISTGS